MPSKAVLLSLSSPTFSSICMVCCLSFPIWPKSFDARFMMDRTESVQLWWLNLLPIFPIILFSRAWPQWSFISWLDTRLVFSFSSTYGVQWWAISSVLPDLVTLCQLLLIQLRVSKVKLVFKLQLNSCQRDYWPGHLTASTFLWSFHPCKSYSGLLLLDEVYQLVLLLGWKYFHRSVDIQW